jgi:hypothetical protein
VSEAAGRTVYFSDDVDRTFWRSWNKDLGRLLSNAVRWAGRDAFDAKVTGDGLLDVFYWETEAGLALHLLNYTTPALMKGPAREISVVGKQEVRLRAPAGFRAGRAVTLSAGQRLPFKMDGRDILLTVPQVGEYEVLAITRGA